MLCITFDNFGLGQDAGYGQGRLPPQMRDERIPISEWENYMQIGLTIGQPRMLGLLKELKLPTTFYAEGFSAVLHPAELKRWADEGHEIGLHGWKHEIWSKLGSQEREEHLVSLSMAAMTELLGDTAPVGMRPPGFKINPWTEDILEKHGIRYVSQVAKRDQAFTDRFAKLGLAYSDAAEDIPLRRLKVQLISDDLTDAYLVGPAYGGMFGEGDADQGYEIAYRSAVAHERARPTEPWIFVAHPMFSGNRAWFAFEKFMRRLHSDFGSSSFKTARDVVLGSAQ